MKQSEIKRSSAVELQEKLSLTKKTYADLKMVSCFIASKIHFQIRRSVRRTPEIGYRANKESCNHCNLPKDGRKRNLRKERVL
jgi:large subunit ribosomal protein L29